MRLMLSFFRAYPGRRDHAAGAAAVGIAEGIGLSALLPLLNIALGAEATSMLTGVAATAKRFRTHRTGDPRQRGHCPDPGQHAADYRRRCGT